MTHFSKSEYHLAAFNIVPMSTDGIKIQTVAVFCTQYYDVQVLRNLQSFRNHHLQRGKCLSNQRTPVRTEVVITASLDVTQCSLVRHMQQKDDPHIHNSDKIEFHITVRIP